MPSPRGRQFRSISLSVGVFAALAVSVVMCAAAAAAGTTTGSAAGTTTAAAAATIPEKSWAWTAPYAAGTAMTALAKGPSGSLYAAGVRDGVSAGQPAGATILATRLDAATGRPLWARATKGPGRRGARVVAAATGARRTLLLAGVSALGAEDGLVLAYSSSGRLLWSRRFAGDAAGPDAAAAVAADSRGNVFVAGSVSDAATGEDGVVYKYDAAGVLRWTYLIASAYGDRFTSVAVDTSGNVYATGTCVARAGYAQMVTVKLRGNGKLAWRVYTDLHGTVTTGVSVVVRSGGAAAGVYAAGSRTGGDTGAAVVPRVGKYTLDGAKVWGGTLPLTLTALTGMAVGADGRPVVAGAADDAVSGVSGGVLGFVAGDGSAAGSLAFAGSGGPAALSGVAAGSGGRLYAAGWAAPDTSAAVRQGVVVTCPSSPATPATFDGQWRYTGPVSGAGGAFSPLLVTADGVFAAGTRSGPDGALQGVVEAAALAAAD